jgi:tRNA acetyltransferase TAN1
MPGDSGIFATCNKGREAKCVGELRDLFAEYAEQLYGDGDADENEGEGTTSIENDIEAELKGIQKPPKGQLFVPVKLDVQCGELPTYLPFTSFARIRV